MPGTTIGTVSTVFDLVTFAIVPVFLVASEITKLHYCSFAASPIATL